MNVDTDKYNSLIYMVINKLGYLGVNNIARKVCISSTHSSEFLRIFLVIDDKEFGDFFSINDSVDFVAEKIIEKMLENVKGTKTVTDTVHGITKKYLQFD